MTEIIHPVLSRNKILKALVVAVLIGGGLFVCAIMPAEYGIDPLGSGRLLGLNRLQDNERDAGEVAGLASHQYPLIKMEVAGSGPEVKRPAEADNPPPETQYEVREDSAVVTVPAGKGIEYKVYMLKHGRMKYEWTTEKGVLYYDFHGEVNQEQPANDVYFESYTISNSDNTVGTFLSPFEGKHGWYFKNNGDSDVTVVIRLKGQYVL